MTTLGTARSEFKTDHFNRGCEMEENPNAAHAIPAHSPARRILLVSSDIEKTRELRSRLEEQGFAVREASDFHNAVQHLSSRWPCSGVICDNHLHDGSGVQFLHWLRRESFTIPFLLLTERPLPDLKPRKGFDCLVIPATTEALCAAFSHLLAKGPAVIGERPANVMPFSLAPVAHDETH